MEENDYPDVPGIGGRVFKLVLDTQFGHCDLLGSLVVLDFGKEQDNGFVHKVAEEESFLHAQFLYKYSQWLHFKV